MSDHARLSPSAAHRWMACPGSIALEESLPKTRSDSVHSQEGTAAHELGQRVLEAEGRNCADYIAQKMSNGWMITADMAYDTQVYVDNIKDYAKGNTLQIEKRVDFSTIIDVPFSFGTADAIILTADGEELQIHDLKFGRGIQVFAEQNEQLMIYALGALQEHSLTHDFSRVRLVIHQPRLHHLSEWDCTLEDLIIFSKRLKAQAKKAVSILDRVVANTDLSPGEKQCRWCKAAAICPALASKVQQTVGADFETIIEEGVTDLIPTDHVSLARKMDAADLIESWCKAVRGEIERVLLAGESVPGYKLVQGRLGSRAWTDETAVEQEFKTMRLKVQEMYDFKLISPTAAEKLLKDSPRKWKRMEQLVTRAAGKPSVAPESDKRPVLILTPVAEEFSPIAESIF